MKTRFKHVLAGLATATAAAFATAPAHAVDYVGASFASLSAGNSVVSYGAGAAQSFDVNFGVLTKVTLAFVTFSDELSPTMNFNARVNNFAGFNIEGLLVKLTGGAVFQTPNGTVTPTFGTIASTSVTPGLVSTTLSTGEGFAINFGNPLAQVGQTDWTINFSAVEAGSSFDLTVTAVPEPETFGMLLAGLALMGMMARRRKP